MNKTANKTFDLNSHDTTGLQIRKLVTQINDTNNKLQI